MEMLISILIGVWLAIAGIFYGVFVKREFARFGIPYGNNAAGSAQEPQASETESE